MAELSLASGGTYPCLLARYFDHGKTLTDGSWEFDYAVEPFANSTLSDATLNKAVLGELFSAQLVSCITCRTAARCLTDRDDGLDWQ